jgi:pimeloyl-ACP methyl ester carboxylesterase
MTQIIPIIRAPSSIGDIVFVHGLGGDPLQTWGFEHSNSWKDWIQANRPDLNIWSIQYDVEPSEWQGGAMPLSDRALNILALLDNRGIGTRPIIFIGHSMGGLLIKEMLRHSLTITTRFKRVAESTKAVVFFSTPNTGSSISDIATFFSFLVRPTVAVSELAAQQPRLRDLNLWFRNNYGALGLKICIFYETQETSGVRVVNETSADPGIPLVSPIPIDSNHITITKPESYDDIVVGQTLKTIDEAVPSANYRYDPEKQFQDGTNPRPKKPEGVKPGSSFWTSLRNRPPIKLLTVIVLTAFAAFAWFTFIRTKPPTLVIDREMYIGHYVGLPQVMVKVKVDNTLSSHLQFLVNSATLISPNNSKQIRLFPEVILNCNGSVPTTFLISIGPKSTDVCVYSLVVPPNLGQLTQKLDESANQKGGLMSGPRDNLIEGPLLKELRDMAAKNFPWEAGIWTIRLDYSLSGSPYIQESTFKVSDADIVQLKRLFDYYGSGYGVYFNWRYLTPDGSQPMRQVAAESSPSDR